MSQTVIRVENLSKQYVLGALRHDTLRDQLAAGMRRLAGRGTASPDQNRIWALQDVSFAVDQGEIIGVIGRNGSGKSTLLKILARITRPTRGRATIRGQVGSLLEVGTGFHAELTGRENIYLNGAILGMTRQETQRKFDEIVAFAEVEKFIDTPVKRYSSGMYLRLAFAVAAHLESEILLVDEVLAVGDAAFQKKCLGKMGSIVDEGRTILFVSHNMTAIQGLCSRAIWLDLGQMLEDGPTQQVVSNYLRSNASGAHAEQTWDDFASAPGSDEVRLHRVAARPRDGQPQDAITVLDPVVLEFEYWNQQPGLHLNLSLFVHNEQGIMVFNTAPLHEPVWHGRPFPVGLFRSVCHIPGSLLNDGTYRVTLLVVKDQAIVLSRHADILTFEVQDSSAARGAWLGQWPGVVRPLLEWETELRATLSGAPVERDSSTTARS